MIDKKALKKAIVSSIVAAVIVTVISIVAYMADSCFSSGKTIGGIMWIFSPFILLLFIIEYEWFKDEL